MSVDDVHAKILDSADRYTDEIQFVVTLAVALWLHFYAEPSAVLVAVKFLLIWLSGMFAGGAIMFHEVARDLRSEGVGS